MVNFVDLRLKVSYNKKVITSNIIYNNGTISQIHRDSSTTSYISLTHHLPHIYQHRSRAEYLGK